MPSNSISTTISTSAPNRWKIAVCAQHNNGGLAANHWWESLNIRHLFPVGEVNGSHGVYRPGGSALNAGQVGAIRAADFIAHRYAEASVDRKAVKKAAKAELARLKAYLGRGEKAEWSWKDVRAAFRDRMTEAGAHIRESTRLDAAVKAARADWRRLSDEGCAHKGPRGIIEALRTRQLCFAHLVYLEAVRSQVSGGVGSRGSALVLDPAGVSAHRKLGEAWHFAEEHEGFRDKVLSTTISGERITNRWIKRRPIPKSDLWFETAWAAYREGRIYD